jgi:hypothetical protein
MFFQKPGDVIETGPTANNLHNLRIITRGVSSPPADIFVTGRGQAKISDFRSADNTQEPKCGNAPMAGLPLTVPKKCAN